VAVGGAGVGVGISGMAMGVGLGAQPFTAITAIVRQVTKNLVSVFISDLPVILVKASISQAGRNVKVEAKLKIALNTLIIL
jgi:hypothetical protein